MVPSPPRPVATALLIAVRSTDERYVINPLSAGPHEFDLMKFRSLRKPNAVAVCDDVP
jgi:hypothetical protein